MYVCMYNNLYKYFTSGIKREHSCIDINTFVTNVNVLVTHNILNLLDEGLSVSGAFLDISTKSCDKVWVKGLTYQVYRFLGVGSN